MHCSGLQIYILFKAVLKCWPNIKRAGAGMYAFFQILKYVIMDKKLTCQHMFQCVIEVRITLNSLSSCRTKDSQSKQLWSSFQWDGHCSSPLDKNLLLFHLKHIDGNSCGRWGATRQEEWMMLMFSRHLGQTWKRWQEQELASVEHLETSSTGRKQTGLSTQRQGLLRWTVHEDHVGGRPNDTCRVTKNYCALKVTP